MQRVIKRIFNQLSGVDGLTCEWPCLPYASPRQTKETRGARLFFPLCLSTCQLRCAISREIFTVSPPFHPGCPQVLLAHLWHLHIWAPVAKACFPRLCQISHRTNQWQRYKTSEAFWTAAANITYLCITFVFDTVFPLWEPLFFFSSFFFLCKTLNF